MAKGIDGSLTIIRGNHINPFDMDEGRPLRRQFADRYTHGEKSFCRLAPSFYIISNYLGYESATYLGPRPTSRRVTELAKYTRRIVRRRLVDLARLTTIDSNVRRHLVPRMIHYEAQVVLANAKQELIVAEVMKLILLAVRTRTSAGMSRLRCEPMLTRATGRLPERQESVTRSWRECGKRWKLLPGSNDIAKDGYFAAKRCARDGPTCLQYPGWKHISARF